MFLSYNMTSVKPSKLSPLDCLHLREIDKDNNGTTRIIHEKDKRDKINITRILYGVYGRSPDILCFNGGLLIFSRILMV